MTTRGVIRRVALVHRLVLAHHPPAVHDLHSVRTHHLRVGRVVLSVRIHPPRAVFTAHLGLDQLPRVVFVLHLGLDRRRVLHALPSVAVRVHGRLGRQRAAREGVNPRSHWKTARTVQCTVTIILALLHLRRTPSNPLLQHSWLSSPGVDFFKPPGCASRPPGLHLLFVGPCVGA